MNTRITPNIIFVTVLILSSAVVSESRAATQSGHPQPRHVVVPSPAYPTIQRGIDAVADRGTVFVRRGVYNESLSVRGKQVDIEGEGARGERRTEIVGLDRDAAVITYGPRAGGSLGDVVLSGGAYGVAGVKERDPLRERDSFPSPLVIRESVIRGSGRGIYGSFSTLIATEIEIGPTTWNGLSILDLEQQFVLFNSYVHDAGGVGALIYNFNPNAFLGPIVYKSGFGFNKGGGLVIYGGAKHSAINTCVFSNNNVFGVLLLQAGDVTVDTVSVNDTAVRLDDGAFGCGLCAVLSGQVNITNCFIQTSAFGILNIGSSTTMVNTTLSCNGISLDAEEDYGVPPQFNLLGGNQCSEVDPNDLQCKPVACQILTSKLAAPTPPAP
jgi:hypothetical protein